jgi:hypothetical protein
VTYQQFNSNRLTPEQMEWLYLERPDTLERWIAWKREDASTRAQQTVDATLTEAWRRLIGPAWRLVATLMRLRLEAEFETGSSTTGHVFASQDALAATVGVSARTLRHWLSKDHPGAKYLACWVSRRTWYVTREDGYRSRGGTVWRVSVEPRGTEDLTRAPGVSYDALCTPWRSSADLPGAIPRDEDALASNCGNKNAPEEYVPKEQGRLEVQVEGRHRSLHRVTSTRSGFHSGNALPTPARAQFAQAWSKAESVCKRLGDGASTGYWFAQFRALERSGAGDGAIWSAVGQALEARAAGRLTRATAAGYAVGILKRTGVHRARA